MSLLIFVAWKTITHHHQELVQFYRRHLATGAARSPIKFSTACFICLFFFWVISICFNILVYGSRWCLTAIWWELISRLLTKKWKKWPGYRKSPISCSPFLCFLPCLHRWMLAFTKFTANLIWARNPILMIFLPAIWDSTFLNFSGFICFGSSFFPMPIHCYFWVLSGASSRCSRCRFCFLWT